MAITQLYSSRQKKLRGEINDVYSYEEIPEKLIIQIILIIQQTIGKDPSAYARVNKFAMNVYENIYNILCREYGFFTLIENEKDYEQAVLNYFFQSNDYETCLDIIELFFKFINNFNPDSYRQYKTFTTSTQDPSDAIEELNFRFKEAGVGYQFESNEIIRVDSQFLHAETVKPVLALLGSDESYNGTNDEFLSAHEHYRHNRYKECLTDCLKSFESIMKAIHAKHDWPLPGDTASKLIRSCLSHNLIPPYLQSQFENMQGILESGIPTVRNKVGAHGQGEQINVIPEHLASYVLHLTATNLLFLAQCEEDYNE